MNLSEDKDMREIRKIGPEIMDEYMYIYLNAYPAFKDLDEDCYKKYEAKNIRDMELDDDVDFYGCFENGKLVATMKLVSFSMNIYGKMKKAVGLMALGVHPLHKKQGIALEMVRFYEKYAVEHGAIICPLLPFRMDFYRTMGYGLGSRMDEYHLPTKNLPGWEDLSGLRPLSLDEIGEVFAVNDRFCEMNHGMLKKFSEEKRLMEADTATQRMGCFKDGALTGYAAYRFENASETNYTLNRIVIDELVYFDGETLRKLLGFFRNQADLAQTIVIRSGEEDFYHLFTDPSHISGYYIPNGYLQTNVSAICNMYKVMDPEAFVKETAYRILPPLELVAAFEYHDEMADEEGRLVIRFVKKSDGTSSWAVASEGEMPDVTLRCMKGDLSSILMGSAHIGALARLGIIETDKPEYTDMLDMLLYHKQRPFSNNDF